MASQGVHEIPTFLADAINEMQRLADLRRLLAFGFAMGSQLSTIIEQLPHMYQVPGLAALLAPLKAESDAVRSFAESELNGGFTLPGGLLIVRFITIIEDVVAQAVVWSFRSRPLILERSEVRRLKGSLAEFARASDSERAELLATALTRELGASLKIGVGKYEALLEIVGLGGGLDANARELIFELTEIRNVIVHRNGRADARLIERCKSLNLCVGEYVKFSGKMLDCYHAAVAYYVLEITARWAESEGYAIRTEPFFSVPMAEALSNMHTGERTG